ncbi:MAG: hypothetical protein VX640_03120 [Pseudomonadota bacterium]|nr:hypothetical protein [Pseudomonadota bacterium]
MTGEPGLTAGLAFAALGLLAVGLSYFLSRALARLQFLPDRPTARSNHRATTPRSGGIAIIAAFGVSTGLAAFLDPAVGAFALSIVALGFLAFAVGFADDLLTLPPLWKFAGQVAAAGLFMLLLGPLQAGPAPFFGEIDLGSAGMILTFAWIVGFMNAYNFMDGINGVAASCGALALAGLAAACVFFGAPAAGLAACFAAAALAGFLPLNFPKGRLFMGDGGSQAAGFLIAALAVVAANNSEGAVSALFLPTAMAPFLYDVAFTLVHRARRRRNILSAHSEHLYQLLVRFSASHAQSTALYLALTAFSTGAAILMLIVDPAWQWLVPAALALVFTPPALKLYARARSVGLIAPAARLDEDAAEAAEPAPFPHAAE